MDAEPTHPNTACEATGTSMAAEAAPIPVFVQGLPDDVLPLLEISRGRQNCFRFMQEPSEGGVPLRLTGQLQKRPYYLSVSGGIILSTVQSGQIACYLGVTRADLFLRNAMIALVQWRAITLNALLRPEDFSHAEPRTCVFAAQPSIGGHTIALEHGYVCPACHDFFSCLGAEPEIDALQHVLAG